MARTDFSVGRLALVALTALALGGCPRTPVVLPVAAPALPPPVAAPKPPPARTDLFVVLPDADGKTGQVTVTQGGAEQVLSTPYAAARIGPSGRLESSTASPQEVRQTFGATVDALPPRPVSFVIYFLQDSDEVTPESRERAQALLAEVARRPSPEVVVIGHTDRVGTVEYNDRLSLQRAERVRAELVRLGVNPARISVEGRGEREPLVPTPDEMPEPQNRRVEVSVR
jgi:outer membrane protein OmpA-like peptidoglycan-associated protein